MNVISHLNNPNSLPEPVTTAANSAGLNPLPVPRTDSRVIAA